jgi:exopolysaccharide biosynthesis polyprenyl glycosylphosphotransferase
MSTVVKRSQLLGSAQRRNPTVQSASALNFLSSRTTVILTLELLWLSASGAVLVDLSHLVTEQRHDWWLSLSQVATVVFVYAFAFYLMDLYDLDVVAARRTLVLNLTQAIGLVCVTIGFLERCLDGLQLPLKLVLLHAASTSSFVIVARHAVDRLLRTRWPSVSLGFVGPGPVYMQLEKEKQILGWLGFGLDLLGESLRQARLTLREEAGRWHRLVIDEACLTQPRAVSFLQECERGGIKAEKLNSFYERAFGKLDLGPHLVDELALAARHPLVDMNSAIRRALDILLAGLGLLLTLPLTLIIASAIKSDSAGPVFFLQDRVGKNGHLFKMLKFRSMYQAGRPAEGPEWTTSRRDPRITRVGAVMRGFHLDELPQLLNVLKGEMSLVGPRPFHPLHAAQLEKVPYFNLRLLVLPGITGWAQVRCHYSDSVDNYQEVLARDLYYVKHAGLVFDLMILIETVRICLWRRGAR